MFELSVGSKIFLIGEYQVLNGGSALLSVLEPRFRMFVKPGNGNFKGLPQGSPADRYFKKNYDFFEKWDFEFEDPHQGCGGFGASTAQIALLQGFKDGFASFQNDSQFNFDLREIHKSYLEMATSSTGVPPSGADLLAQFQGGLVEVDLGAGKIQRWPWPFANWQVLFFATGKKLATHEHLAELGELNLEALRKIYQRAMEALAQGKASEFVKGFSDYQKELADRGWQAPTTTELLSEIHRRSGVIAAKGCGAMGVDVVAVIVDKESARALVADFEKQLGLRYVGDLDQRTQGFAWKWIPERSLDETCSH